MQPTEPRAGAAKDRAHPTERNATAVAEGASEAELEPPDSQPAGARPRGWAEASWVGAPEPSAVWRYLIAGSLAVIGLGVTILLQPYLGEDTSGLLYAAVCAASWYGGLGPGLLASFVGVAGVHFLFHEPAWHLWPILPADAIRLSGFSIIAILVSSMTQTLRRERLGAEARGQKAQARVADMEILSRELERTNERLVEQTREADRVASRLARLHAVTATLSQAVTPPRVAQTVVEQGVIALGARAGALALLTGDGRTLEVVRSIGYDQALLARFSRISLDDPIPIAEAARTGRPIFVGSAQERDLRYPVLATTKEVAPRGAWAAVPLVVDDRILGALVLTFPEPRDFCSADRDFILALCRQCAQALDRAMVYETERTARTRMEDILRFIADASSILASSLDEDLTLQAVARLAVPRLADLCVVDIVDSEGRIRRVAHSATDPRKDAILEEMAEHYPPDTFMMPLLADLLANPETVFSKESIDDALPGLAQDERHLELLRALEPTSGAVFRLVARDHTVGLLLLAMSESGREYGAEELVLARELARRAAVAVDNARLYGAAMAARTEAESANKAKSEFLARMSHELRTPLNAIGGYCDLIELGLRGPVTEDQLHDLRRIKVNQRHLLKHINDILNFARLESGHLELKLGAVPVDATLAELRALVEPQVREKGLSYVFRPGDPDVCCHADAERLQQIVLNLLSNAIKFTAPGGRVTLSWESLPDAVRIRVEDTGRGIPPDRLATIFDPFVQVDGTLTREGEGTGLGLAIGRELARAMGGDLEVESGPDAGSVFTLTLPRHPD